MKTFKHVVWEISGICNGRCPYCYTGTNKNKTGSFIDLSEFTDSLKILFDKSIIDNNTIFHLYNWGEPFLHPGLKDILDILINHNLKYSLSTNGSIPIKFDLRHMENLVGIKFSMSGFSEDSYSRIHKLDLNNVTSNISEFSKFAKSNGYKGEIQVINHIYRFNTDEINNLKEFADNLGITYFPYYAYLVNWWQVNDYIDNTLTPNELEQIKEDLFTDLLDVQFKTPINYKCPQFDVLAIDENCNILTCCLIPKNHQEYATGNILNGNIEEALRKRLIQETCSVCRSKGIAYYMHNIIQPEGY